MNGRLSGNTGANKTIKRSRTQARIVVTFVVEVSEATLRKDPAWRRHAVDHFRFLSQMSISPQVFINTIRKRSSITILSETVEVAP